MDNEYIYLIAGEDLEDGGYWAYLTPEKAAQYIRSEGPDTDLKVTRYKISEPTDVTFRTEIIEIPATQSKSPPIKTEKTRKFL